ACKDEFIFLRENLLAEMLPDQDFQIGFIIGDQYLGGHDHCSWREIILPSALVESLPSFIYSTRHDFTTNIAHEFTGRPTIDICTTTIVFREDDVIDPSA